jgi:hypothetical protein
MTDEILHIHHWHKQRIHCNDIKTIKEEDLPFIEACCRCNQEREITKTEVICPKCNFSQSFCKCGWEGDPRLRTVSGNPKSILDKARRLEQKREFAGADATLKAYHAKKLLCDDISCRHSKAQHSFGNGECRVAQCVCKLYRPTRNDRYT